ncbi:hypothetical protein COL922a_014396, partial [Colletotrichum nupharicola]
GRRRSRPKVQPHLPHIHAHLRAPPIRHLRRERWPSDPQDSRTRRQRLGHRSQDATRRKQQPLRLHLRRQRRLQPHPRRVPPPSQSHTPRIRQRRAPRLRKSRRRSLPHHKRPARLLLGPDARRLGARQPR